jgi:hypothetical protein
MESNPRPCDCATMLQPLSCGDNSLSVDKLRIRQFLLGTNNRRSRIFYRQAINNLLNDRLSLIKFVLCTFKPLRLYKVLFF